MDNCSTAAADARSDGELRHSKAGHASHHLERFSLLQLRSGDFSVSRRTNRHRKQCIDRPAHVVGFAGDESVYAVFELLSAFTPVWHGHRPVPELARLDLPVDQRHHVAVTRVLYETINQ